MLRVGDKVLFHYLGTPKDDPEDVIRTGIGRQLESVEATVTDILEFGEDEPDGTGPALALDVHWPSEDLVELTDGRFAHKQHGYLTAQSYVIPGPDGEPHPQLASYTLLS